MTARRFALYLLLLTGLTALSLLLAGIFLPALQKHTAFIAATLVLFLFICTALYLSGRSAALSPNRAAFNGIISASVFGKMLTALIFLAAYRKAAVPSDNLYVIVFLCIYALYTGYEVWFMTILGKMRR